MKSLLPGAILALALAIGGCRAAPIYNAEDVAYTAAPSTTAQGFTLDDYRAAIIRAGAKRGWAFTDEGPGHLVGNVAVRNKHFATVDVLFDTEEFSIEYKSSRNLNYDASRGEIHPNYNSWISNLQNDIQAEIAIMKAG
ncbi:hypothetical protein H0I76_16850 [Limibaculum sp. M0105]|uniref:Lipoprotein n=1 Tax=Thermohalobaculum xanthum TaxID=2753746 RepID=A0A8J7M8Z2_9RHOB|nr:hypothetical protein [Thermohalobaculum xanthum]MBK0400871.1 hypothetical protein [Thermohalobaculum xanthum]